MTTTPASPAASQQAAVDAALLVLKSMGLSVEDLTSAASNRAPVPTFAEYVPVVAATLTPSTLRAYSSYWKRTVEQWGGRRLDEPTPSEVKQLVAYVKANAVQRRNSRGGSHAAGQEYRPPVHRADRHTWQCAASAVVGNLERVFLLDGAVGLDDHHAGRRQSHDLGTAGPAEQEAHDLLEQADPGLRFRVPVVEDLGQPVRVRGAGRGQCAPGRRVQPRPVRQQEVDFRRPEVGECPVCPDQVVAQVDGAQQAAVEVREPAEPLQCGGHCLVASPAAGVTPVPVVGVASRLTLTRTSSRSNRRRNVSSRRTALVCTVTRTGRRGGLGRSMSRAG